MSNRSEKSEQRAGVKLLKLLGAQVYVSGTRRLKTDSQSTRQTPGIPDVEAWLPISRHASNSEASRRLVKWEVKAGAGGRLSPAQQEYRQLCLAGGIAHVAGPLDSLIGWLSEAGYLRGKQKGMKQTSCQASSRFSELPR